jgi:hypothetical protein
VEPEGGILLGDVHLHNTIIIIKIHVMH